MADSNGWSKPWTIPKWFVHARWSSTRALSHVDGPRCSQSTADKSDSSSSAEGKGDSKGDGKSGDKNKEKDDTPLLVKWLDMVDEPDDEFLEKLTT